MLETIDTTARDVSTRQDTQQELRAAGVEPRLYETRSGPAAGGLSLRVDAEQKCLKQVTRLLTSLQHHIRAGIPLNLSITNFAGGDTSEYELCRICEAVRESVDARLLSTGLVGTSIQSHQMPLQAYQLICNALLGDGPRYVTLDSLQMQSHCNVRVQEETDRNWRYLWSQRGSSAPVLPAYAASVRPSSPLLATEVAGSVLPASGIPVPGNTAWLPLEIYLPGFADSRGELAWSALEHALEVSVTAGDRLLDELEWSTPAQSADARHNRRLAINISGIGDLACRSGADPADLRCLRQAIDTISRIRARLSVYSNQVAALAGPVPALLQADPCERWSDQTHRHHWRQRWRTALEAASVRNRNLLVLSPYSVLPAAADSCARYADLLPVIQYADAISFASPPDFGGWSFDDYRQFHRRAYAVIKRQDDRCVVAAGV